MAIKWFSKTGPITSIGGVLCKIDPPTWAHWVPKAPTIISSVCRLVSCRLPNTHFYRSKEHIGLMKLRPSSPPPL